ncbi:hypothetical protein PUN28_003157 [Cardiocondyla obscurior]|uniref:Uncharacterized protein n=1 Tax=Cardiocondyla obscurior TaxID=286306 RepID=A0AAW2GHF7_9HYME
MNLNYSRPFDARELCAALHRHKYMRYKLGFLLVTRLLYLSFPARRWTVLLDSHEMNHELIPYRSSDTSVLKGHKTLFHASGIPGGALAVELQVLTRFDFNLIQLRPLAGAPPIAPERKEHSLFIALNKTTTKYKLLPEESNRIAITIKSESAVSVKANAVNFPFN